jgi:hypothetical protein
VLQDKVLIGKFGTIDGFSTRTCVVVVVVVEVVGICNVWTTTINVKQTFVSQYLSLTIVVGEVTSVMHNK